MRSKQFRLVQSLDIVAAIIFTLILASAVIQFNIFATIDGDIHLSWSYFWNQQFFNGQFYPKWFEEAFGGLGSTSFVFYPPLFRIFSLPFGLLQLSPSQQIKGSIILILLLNAGGIVRLSRILFHQNYLHNFLAVSLGILNPFLVNEIFKRGGFPSICSIALIPWIMIGLLVYLREGQISNFIFITLIFAAFFASHIPSSLVFVSAYFPTLILLIILRIISISTAFTKFTLPIVFALLLNAFLILPILFDINFVHQAFVPTINTIKQRLFFQDILKLKPVFFPKGTENNITKIFLFDLIILIITVVFLRVKKTSNVKATITNMQIFLVTFSILMITNLSEPIYTNVSSFRKLQFPWRYLGLTSSLIPYLFVSTIETLSHKFILFRKKLLLFALITIVLLFNYKSAGFILRSENKIARDINALMMYPGKQVSRNLLKDIQVTNLEDKYYYLDSGGKGIPLFFLNGDRQFFPGDVHDYLPKTVPFRDEWLSLDNPLKKREKILLPKPYPQIELVSGQGEFSVIEWGQGKRKLKLEANTETVLNLKTFYYPAWDIQVNPQPKANQKTLLSKAKDGRIQLKLPAGAYNIKIWYKGTLAERIGISISIATFLILCILVLKSKFQLWS